MNSPVVKKDKAAFRAAYVLSFGSKEKFVNEHIDDITFLKEKKDRKALLEDLWKQAKAFEPKKPTQKEQEDGKEASVPGDPLHGDPGMEISELG